MVQRLRQSINRLQKNTSTKGKLIETQKGALRLSHQISQELRLLGLKVGLKNQTIKCASNQFVKEIFIKEKMETQKIQQQLFKLQEKNNETVSKISQMKFNFQILSRRLTKAMQNVSKIKNLEKQVIELEEKKDQYDQVNQVIQQDLMIDNILIYDIQGRAQELEEQNRIQEIHLQELNDNIQTLTQQINDIRRDILASYINPEDKQIELLTGVIENPYDFFIHSLYADFQNVRDKLKEIYDKSKENYDFNVERERIQNKLQINALIIGYYSGFIQNNNNDLQRLLFREFLNDQLQLNVRRVREIDQIIENINTIPVLCKNLESIGLYICNEMSSRVYRISASIAPRKPPADIDIQRNQIIFQNILYNTNQLLQTQNVQQIQVEQVVEQQIDTIEQVQPILMLQTLAQQYNDNIQFEQQNSEHQELSYYENEEYKQN